MERKVKNETNLLFFNHNWLRCVWCHHAYFQAPKEKVNFKLRHYQIPHDFLNESELRLKSSGRVAISICFQSIPKRLICHPSAEPTAQDILPLYTPAPLDQVPTMLLQNAFGAQNR